MFRYKLVPLFIALHGLVAVGQEGVFPTDRFSRDGRIANSFRIRELLFTYQNPLLAKSAVAVKKPEDVAPLDNPEYTAGPTDNVRAMIADMYEQETVLEWDLDRVSLVNHGENGWLWHAKWSFHPLYGGSSGRPWTYLGVVSGCGDAIRPEVSLWSSFPVGGSEFLRSHFKLRKRVHEPGTEIRFGDEVADLAKTHLAEFSAKNELTSLEGYSSKGSSQRITWRLRSLHAIRLSGYQIWQVEFTDESWGAREAINTRGLTLWVSRYGDVSELSLGREEFP